MLWAKIIHSMPSHWLFKIQSLMYTNKCT
jgi:hypothetical protein